MEEAASNQTPTFAPWRLNGIGLLRILFGVIWGIDAWFKWQPAFVNNLNDYVTGALAGQSPQVRAYIHFWHHLVGVDPRLFGYLVAIGETAIAIALIFGVFTNLTSLVGILLSTAIWTTAEGFGGPYHAGSTDVGAAIMYAVIFVGLFLSQSGLFLGLDRRLTPALGKWGFLASGTFPNPFKTPETSSGHPQTGPVTVH
jgi:uncharacterized membrane protein YphA (DoxX/SURF4 family)